MEELALGGEVVRFIANILTLLVVPKLSVVRFFLLLDGVYRWILRNKTGLANRTKRQIKLINCSI